MSHLIVIPGREAATVIAVIADPPTIPVGVTAICRGCEGSISATNDPEPPSLCYWCEHPDLAHSLGIVRRSVVAA